MIHFVGAGPGAPDLITIRGQKLLAKADVIIYAGSLVNPALLEVKKPECAVYNSAHMTLEEVLDVMKKAEQSGKTTVRLHTGDPSLYGAIREQMDALKKMILHMIFVPVSVRSAARHRHWNWNIHCRECPRQLLSAVQREEPPVPERESIPQLARHQATRSFS